MKERSSCYTYFRITGDFCPDEISEMLGLQPEESWNKDDERRNGEKYDFSLWIIGRCCDYDVETDNQMRKTIEPLVDKIDLLNKIRTEMNVQFCLEIVPTLYCGDITPCLAPGLDIIDFCHATRTEIDIDLYLMDSSDE